MTKNSYSPSTQAMLGAQSEGDTAPRYDFNHALVRLRTLLADTHVQIGTLATTRDRLLGTQPTSGQTGAASVSPVPNGAIAELHELIADLERASFHCAGIVREISEV